MAATVRLVGQDVALSRQRHGFESHTVQLGRKLGANRTHAPHRAGSIPDLPSPVS